MLKGTIMKSLEGQQDSLFPWPPGASFWGLHSQPVPSDVRRAGLTPSGNVQAGAYGANRRPAETDTHTRTHKHTHRYPHGILRNLFC